MKIEYLNGISGAPAAVGPYSQAVKAGNMLYLSGQIAINPETGKIEASSIEDQTKQVLKNIQNVLSSQKLNFSNVIKTTIFLTNLADFKTVNSIYENCLGGFKPARSTIEVSALPLGAIVEIEMIAVFPD